MGCPIYHIELSEGSDYTKRFQAVDSSTGLPRDLTNYRAEMQARAEFNGRSQSEVVISLNTEPGGGLTLGGVNGTIDIDIPYSFTIDTTWSYGIYDIFLYSFEGKREKFIKGFFNVDPSSSKLVNSTLADVSASVTPPLLHPNNYDAGALEKP